MQTIENFLRDVERRNPHAPHLLQAVEEVARGVWPLLHANPQWLDAGIMERLVEPDRSISFRVRWRDDAGQVHVDRGYRVQQNRLLGPYKGGLRFADHVDEGVMRFLAFEQTFKGALTGLPLGGAKGGATFDPRGRSAEEVRRFCYAFMTELRHHIGPDKDVPAGDIGVGEREVGFLYGAYRELGGLAAGAMTGKAVAWGGIPLRTEATGYGLIYMVCTALAHHDRALEGLRCAVSGAGNVARHAAAKALEMGARVVSLSNSQGVAHWPDGLRAEQLEQVADAQSNGARLSDVASKVGASFEASAKPWDLPDIDVALPCATQNELGANDAKALLASGRLQLVAEGANMPCTSDATQAFVDAGVLLLPGKAANAGGVATSGLEMSQNAQRKPWTRDTVDEELKACMRRIHDRCVEFGGESSTVDYAAGANRAAFHRLATTMEALG
ncbi:MAG: NADP-specific glutamate dehydrogenase [Nannocystaceae bacterium]|nr:NADP-specific glutamate dehydrogenase [bacterium]